MSRRPKLWPSMQPKSFLAIQCPGWLEIRLPATPHPFKDNCFPQLQCPHVGLHRLHNCRYTSLQLPLTSNTCYSICTSGCLWLLRHLHPQLRWHILELNCMAGACLLSAALKAKFHCLGGCHFEGGGDYKYALMYA